jgi:hypothetical protein
LGQWLHDPDTIKPGTTKNSNASRAFDGMNLPRELTDAEVAALSAYLLAMK